MKATILSFAIMATTALAKTDLAGCESYTTIVTSYGSTYQSVGYYDPSNLEICAFVDCGGGRAPAKSVPGCPLYEGPETVTASFLESDPLGATAAPVTTTEEVAVTTEAPVTTEAAVTTVVESTTVVSSEIAVETSVASSVAEETTVLVTSVATETVVSSVPSSVAPDPTTLSSTTVAPVNSPEATPSGTDQPAGAGPTAMAAVNVVAGVVLLAALL